MTLGQHHARIAALEFLVVQLLANNCMRAADPIVAARALKDAGDLHLGALLSHAADDEQRSMAAEIGVCITMLADMVVAEVTSRPANAP